VAIPRILVVGSANVDLTTFTDRFPSPGETIFGDHFDMGWGGKGANQAVAARLCGAEVDMIVRVGDDLFGPATIANFKAQGIGTDHARVVPGVSSGVAPIFVESNGQNRILVVKGANDRLDPAAVDEAMPLLERAIAADDGYLFARIERALLLGRMGLTLAASRELDEAAVRSPRAPGLLRVRAQAADEAQLYDQALALRRAYVRVRADDADALEALARLHPGLRDRVVTEQGEVRPHVNVFVEDVNIRDARGLQTRVPEGCEIAILPAVSGG